MVVDGVLACEHSLRGELSKEEQIDELAGEHLYPPREQRMEGALGMLGKQHMCFWPLV